MALKVLAEKLNVQGLDRDELTPSQRATACLKAVEKQFKKVSLLFVMAGHNYYLPLSLSLLFQEFTLEFSRDRKSMSVYCRPTPDNDDDSTLPSSSSSPLMFVKGAPERILDRCSFVRVNGQERKTLTPEIKQQILDIVRRYGTGRHGNCSHGNHCCVS